MIDYEALAREMWRATEGKAVDMPALLAEAMRRGAEDMRATCEEIARGEAELALSKDEERQALSIASAIAALKADATPPDPRDETIRKLREPTEAMLNAARDWSLKKYGQGIGNEAVIGCWRAMFDAAFEKDETR